MASPQFRPLDTYVMHDDLPVVLEDDDGIRPAGKPDECFYCHQKVGQTHNRGCVIINRRVEVVYTVKIEQFFPAHFTQEDILHHLNRGHLCANRIFDDLDQHAQRSSSCLCDAIKAVVAQPMDGRYYKREKPKSDIGIRVHIERMKG